MGSDAKNMDPIWLDMKVCVCVQMSDTGSDAETMDPVWLDLPGVCVCVCVCADVRHWQWCRNYGPSMTWPAWCMCVCVCVQMSDTGSDAETMDPVWLDLPGVCVCVCADVRHWQWCREHGPSARQYCEGAPQGTGTSPQASPTGQTAEGKVDHSCWGFQAKLTSTEARQDSEWRISCTVGTTCCLKKCIMQQEVTERKQQMRGWG